MDDTLYLLIRVPAYGLIVAAILISRRGGPVLLDLGLASKRWPLIFPGLPIGLFLWQIVLAANHGGGTRELWAAYAFFLAAFSGICALLAAARVQFKANGIYDGKSMLRWNNIKGVRWDERTLVVEGRFWGRNVRRITIPESEQARVGEIVTEHLPRAR